MFTPEEENLLRLFATDKGNLDRLWFYVAVLAAPVAMAIYGLLRRDYLALAVAFFGLLVLVAWSIARELSHVAQFRSVSQKLVESGVARLSAQSRSDHR